MIRAYTIEVVGERVTVQGPLPCEDLMALVALAEHVCGRAALADGLVAKHLRVTMALCSPAESLAWRRQLGLVSP